RLRYVRLARRERAPDAAVRGRARRPAPAAGRAGPCHTAGRERRSAMSVKIGVVGCAGRMGIALLKRIAATEGATLSGGTERPGHAALGRDLGELAGLGALGLT